MIEKIWFTGLSAPNAPLKQVDVYLTFKLGTQCFKAHGKTGYTNYQIAKQSVDDDITIHKSELILLELNRMGFLFTEIKPNT